MYRTLSSLDVLIVNGFAITADAYRYVLDRSDAWPALHSALDGLDAADIGDHPNEYATLIGGAAFEPKEQNPMLGLRGASRYTHPAYADGFALECAAMKRVRDVMGLKNVILMIPFCRRVDEAERVVRRMAELGLRRGENGLKIYVMCEIPNNVVLIDQFAMHCDGFSIGSNDLTQLVLGVDRDSELVAFEFDERDPGVIEILRLAVTGAKRNGRYVGICGQAPSDYPEIADLLVDLGIDSIALNPDSIVKTGLHLAARAEQTPISRGIHTTFL